MCGIVGFTHLRNIQREPEMILKKMLNNIKYRGPDDEGFYKDQDICLGVCRLSIIDIKGSHQPIHNEAKTVWLVFNGEIYNFIELKEDLEKKGHLFYTKGDPEVIIHLYEELGINCLDKLNGMFAFALWDKLKKILFLARDRFGIKPLYYSEFKGEIIFASEAKSILNFPGFRKELDLVSLDQYLTFEYIPCPRSILKGIKKIPAGNYLLFAPGASTVNKYWDISFNHDTRIERSSTKEIQEKLHFLIESAVKSQLISEVPLGIFLSGGIDSTTITAFASKTIPGIETFSMGFNEESFDETKYAKEASREFNTKHNHYTFNLKDLNNVLFEVIKFLDEPLGDASIFPTYLLSKFAKRKITVALSGEGGDEIFGGYPTYIAHQMVKYYRLAPSFIKKNINKIINALPISLANFSLDFIMRRFISEAHLPPETRHINWMGSFTALDKQSLYSVYLKEVLKEQDTFRPIQHYLSNCNDNEDMLNRLQYLDIKTYLQDGLLVKADRASMANSLELRVPYLDNALVEFMFSIPSKLKVNHLNTKYIFKESSKHILPDNIIKRRKKGFGIPIGYWIKNGFKETLLKKLCKERIKKEGLFNTDYINLLIKQHLTQRVDHRKKLWTLFMFEMWKENWL